MGNSHSRTVYPIYGHNENAFESNNEFYEISFAELVLNSNFSSSLAEKITDEVIQPLNIFPDSLLALLISYPQAFGETEDIRDVWKSKLSPNISGFEKSNSIFRQILTELFKFFKVRPLTLIDNEIAYRSEWLQLLQQEKNILIPSNLVQSHSASISLPPIYSKTTENNLFDKAGVIPKEEYSNNISSIIYSIQFLFTDLMKSESKSAKIGNLGFEKPLTVPLCNGIFYPRPYSTLPSAKLPYLVNPRSSIISCDSNHVYIVDRVDHSTIKVHRINLSDKNLDEHQRLTTISLPIKESGDQAYGFAISNGYGILVQSKTHYILKLPECEIVRETSCKIHCLVTSDGRYIYSLIKKSIFESSYLISVFELQCSLNNQVELVQIHQTNIRNLAEIKDSYIIFCNGPILTIVNLEVSDVDIIYQYQNYSVIDGAPIINPFTVYSQYHIVSITAYPWQKRIIEVIRVGHDFSLIRLPNYSSQPSWLSEANPCFDWKPEKGITKAIRNITQFLSYSSIHLNGSSFRSFTQNRIFSIDAAKFFSPCTPFVISSIVNAINFFISLLNMHNYPNTITTILLSLFRLLNLNMSNFPERGINDISSNIIPIIINCFKVVQLESNLHFLRPMVAFTIANSFQLIFKNHSQKSMELLVHVLKSTSNNLRYYIVKQIYKYPEYPSSIGSSNIRDIFCSILNDLSTNGHISDSEMLLLTSFVEAIFLEMKKIYTNNQGEFTGAEKVIYIDFCSMNGLILETISKYLNELNELNDSFGEQPIVIFLRKWLTLLEPFPQFNRASVAITGTIQPLYAVLSRIITKFNIPLTFDPISQTINDFRNIFYETFSILIDSIGALLDGGSEIKDIHKYLWLLKSTIHDNINKKVVAAWFDEFQANREQKSHGPRIINKRGVSYNLFPEDEKTDPNQLQDFINFFLIEKPTDAIMAFFDFLCEACKTGRPPKQPPDSKKVEIVVFSCLIKQLGLTNKLFLESRSFMINRTCNASIFKNVINSLYKIRIKINFSKQQTQSYDGTARNNTAQAPPTLLQQYDKFLEEIMKKAVFLLNVNPCLRFESSESASQSDMLNNLTLFLTSPSTTDVYLDIVESIIESFQHISTGFAIAQTILRDSIANPAFMDCANCMIEHLAQNTSILQFLESNNSSRNRSDFQLNDQIVSFLNTLLDFFKFAEEKESFSSSIVFMMNICMVIPMNEKILAAIDKLIDALIETRDNQIPHHEYVHSYLFFVAYTLMITNQVDETLKTKPMFIQCVNKLMPESITENTVPMIQILHTTGIQNATSMKDIFRNISTCSPLSYPILLSYLYVLILNCPVENEKIELLYEILKTISLTVSGCPSLIMSKYKYKYRVEHLSHIIKSSPLILSCCFELIQLCRRLLKSNDKVMWKIIDETLKEKSDDQLYTAFSDSRDELLYGIFAILSNVIEGIHCQSFIKNTKTNKTYFVKQFITAHNAVQVYPIPIDPLANPITIRLTNDFVPVSMLPFNAALYNHYDLLIPIFLKSLQHEFSPSLSIMIYGSLREYCIDTTFCLSFSKVLTDLSFDCISYTNSIPQFVQLLRNHLDQPSYGFTNNTDNKYLTKQFDPNQFGFSCVSDPIRIEMPQMEKFFQVPDSGLFSAVSNIMSLDNNCKLSLRISAADFDVGIICPSLNSNNDFLLVSARKSKCDLFRIDIVYNKFMGASIIINQQPDNEYKLHNKVKMIESPFCFIFNYYSGGQFWFSFTSSNPLTDFNLFKHQNPPSKNDYNSLKDSPITENTYMAIPYLLWKSLPKSLETSSTDLKSLYPVDFYPLQDYLTIKQTKQRYSTETISEVVCDKDTTELLDESDTTTIIDKWTTGLPIRVNKSNKCLIGRPKFVNRYELDILPPHLINYYTNQLVLDCYSEICNYIFIRFIQNCPQIAFDYTYNLFKPSWVKHFLNLLMIVEPILLRNYEPSLLQLDIPNSMNNAECLELNNSTQPILVNNADTNAHPQNNNDNDGSPNNNDDSEDEAISCDSSSSGVGLAQFLLQLVGANGDSEGHEERNEEQHQEEEEQKEEEENEEEDQYEPDFDVDFPSPSNGTINQNENDDTGKGDDCFKEVQKASIEPIIDFKFNLLDPNAPLKANYLEQYLSALREIINIINEKNSQDQFAEDWFTYLDSQFKSGFSHSCLPSSRSGMDSYFVNMKNELSPFIISRKDVIAWVICYLGFSCNSSKRSVIKHGKKAIKKCIYCTINDVRMTKPLITVKGSTVVIKFHKKPKSLVLIPVTANYNDSLVGSFVNLALSFKYFINYISERQTSLKNIQKYKLGVYNHCFNGIISRSPFFYVYLNDILQYLQEKLKIIPSDLTSEFVRSINTLAVYSGEIPKIKSFIREQQLNWNERTLLPLNHFFPDFMADADRNALNSIDVNSVKFQLPSKMIPNTISQDDDLNLIIRHIKRLVPQYTTIAGFPYYLIINEWKDFTIRYFPYEMKSINDSTLEVKFTLFTPKYIRLNVYSADIDSSSSYYFTLSSDPIMSQSIIVTQKDLFNINSNTLYIRCNYELDLFKLLITIPSNEQQPYHNEVINSINSNDFILNNKQLFINDMKMFSRSFTYVDDQRILKFIPDEVYMCNNLDFDYFNSHLGAFLPSEIIKKIPYRLVMLRAKVLCVLNWLIHIDPKLLEEDYEMKSLIPSISMNYKLKIFTKEIYSKSNSSRHNLEIDRSIAYAFRNNEQSNDIQNTIISQMTKLYQNPSNFRCKGNQPFTVKFQKENGLDAGGLSRELLTECANELSNPHCGLVVPVPNAIREVGEYRDCVIPISSPLITNPEQQYNFVGALIAIVIRTDLPQPFMFPPLVWKYLLNEELVIDDIFEIDKCYQQTIQSIQNAMNSDITNQKFKSQFQLTFTIVDSNGQTRDLINQGSTISIDKTNCNQYILLSNQFRITEIKQNLAWMRKGMWTNFNLTPPSILDWNTLQFAASAHDDISIDALKKITRFMNIPPDQIAIFWKVIASFNQQERGEFLRYTTGVSRLPTKCQQSNYYLTVDSKCGTDIIPGSSTCFNEFHMPTFTSVQKAIELINLALVYGNGEFDEG